jgi:hypothetical protein
MGNITTKKPQRAVNWLTRQDSSGSASADDVQSVFEELGYEFDPDEHLGHVGGTKLVKCRYFRLVDGPTRVSRKRLVSDEKHVRDRLRLADGDTNILVCYVSGYWVVFVDNVRSRSYYRLCAGRVWPPKITV